MKISYLYPNGKQICLTMSYDDGPREDVRLIELFNKYHIKATFHLNSGRIGNGGWMKPEDVKTIYAGHEVSCHSVTHPFFDQLPKEEILHEMLDDKRALEEMVGYPVRGMSYPNGIVTEEVLNVLRASGIRYGRLAGGSNNFKLPLDFLNWMPTCHHSGNILGKIDDLKNGYYAKYAAPLFYIWGHAFEFPRNTENNSWTMMEEFCDRFTTEFEDKVWYATSIEIYDYLTALRSLELSVNRTIVTNNSRFTVWLSVDGQPVEIKPGVTNLA